MSDSHSQGGRPRALVPRAERIPSDYISEISGPTVATFRSRIRNISTSGMLMDAPDSISIGDVVMAAIPGNGSVMGTVARKRDGTAGVKFLRDLDLEAFRKHAAS